SLNSNQDALLQAVEKAGGNTSAWLDNKPIFATTANPVAVPPSQNFPSDFSGVVHDGGRLYLRAGTTARTSRGRLVVVSSTPLAQRILLAIASGLGEITLEQSTSSAISNSGDSGAASLRPILTAGTVSAARNLLDRPVNLSTSIAVTDWANGQTANSAAIDVQTRASALY